jgi:hypothetical protein
VSGYKVEFSEDSVEWRELAHGLGINGAKSRAQQHHDQSAQAAVEPDRTATAGTVPDIPADLDRRPGANGVAA